MIADRSGKYDVEFAAYPRSELTEMLESGEIDCFVSKYSSEFDGYLKSESFFYSGCAFLVMADSMYHDAKITDEIKNADICSLGGSAEGATFDLADVTYYETLDEVKTALDGGAHDGFAGDYLVARVLRTKLEFDNAFRLFPDALLEGDDNCHCLYFKSENENMVYGVNNGIAKLTVDDVTQSAETHVEILT